MTRKIAKGRWVSTATDCFLFSFCFDYSAGRRQSWWRWRASTKAKEDATFRVLIQFWGRLEEQIPYLFWRALIIIIGWAYLEAYRSSSKFLKKSLFQIDFNSSNESLHERLLFFFHWLCLLFVRRGAAQKSRQKSYRFPKAYFTNLFEFLLIRANIR